MLRRAFVVPILVTPVVDFFLFAMGNREKYLYALGQLRNTLTDRVVRTWEVGDELIAPPAYMVTLRIRDDKTTFVFGDESAMWMESGGKREPLSRGDIKLLDFEGLKHRLVLYVPHIRRPLWAFILGLRKILLVGWFYRLANLAIITQDRF